VLTSNGCSIAREFGESLQMGKQMTALKVNADAPGGFKSQKTANEYRKG
jgi:hypothetical protein